MKKSLLFGIFALYFMFVGFGVAGSSERPKFEIIPEAEDTEWIGDVSDLGEHRPNSNGHFFIEYSEIANKYEGDEDGKLEDQCSGLGKQFASGIMDRDTILCLASQVVRFVANMGLVVGALMMIYAGYLYVFSVFRGGGGIDQGTSAIKYAIMGIVVIIFAYAILKILMSAFL